MRGDEELGAPWRGRAPAEGFNVRADGGKMRLVIKKR